MVLYYSKYQKYIKFILFFSIFFGNKNSTAQQIDSIISIYDSLIVIRDSLFELEEFHKKEDRKTKVENTFKYISYINYSDRGDGVQYKGIDKYKIEQNKEIVNIYIKILPPFGSDEYEQLKKSQKLGNKLHLNSKEWQARQDLLFKKGEKVNPSIFADTERLLWERNRYKYVDISFSQSCDDENIEIENGVDVYVFLVDKLSYTISTGYVEESVAIATYINNLFGLPNMLSLRFQTPFNKLNPLRFTTAYDYFNLFGSKIDFRTDFVFDKLNRKFSVGLKKNFVSLNSNWGFNFNYNFNNIKVSLNNNLRDPSSLVGAKSNEYNLWLAYAFPIKKKNKASTLKFILSTKLNYTNYMDRPFIIDGNYNEQFINNSNFLFGFGFAHWEYVILKNNFYIDIPEYLPKKWSLALWLGPKIDEIVGLRNNLELKANYGKSFKKVGYFYTDFKYSTFVRKKKSEQMLISLAQSYITPSYKISKNVFLRQLISTKFNYGFFYPENRYFNINNLIRGFYSPTLRGSKSVTASFETNLLLNKKIAMSKGMLYAFADVGWVSDNEKKLISQSYFQYGVGFGLRLRSVDLGFPFIDFQFSFYPKGKDFNVNTFQFRLYESSINAITTDNLFFNEPRLPNVLK
ncbi:MAG: hypothetical protein K1X26_06315 [Chitinophagales bacterium]|nr:hypothetical protein [Chitinophagales bacterium]